MSSIASLSRRLFSAFEIPSEGVISPTIASAISCTIAIFTHLSRSTPGRSAEIRAITPIRYM
nr:hypothetical protein Iba_chr08eCG11660 [Ipomoea batatas]